MKNLGPCLNWGAGKSNGYGWVVLKDRRTGAYAHRLAYADAHNIPLEQLKGVVIRHKCDNPACFNPSHLEPGTQTDNMRDMRARGRAGNASFEVRSAAQRKRYAEKPMSAEHRANLSAAHIGHKHSEETKQKIRAAQHRKAA